MEIYVLKVFDKNTRGGSISDADLCTAANEIMKGLFDGDLGGGIIKKRIPLPGKGKSDGARAIIAFQTGRNLFFINGYLKSNISNRGKEIPDDALKGYRKFAADLQNMTEEQIAAQIKNHTMREVKCNG